MSSPDESMCQKSGLLDRLHVVWWRTRRALKDALPIARRRSLNKLMRKYEALLDAAATSPLASAARVRIVSQREIAQGAEVCLFVTHAPRAVAKPHVIAHVEQLLDSGFEVILIVAKDGDLDQYDLPAALASRLTALMLRENVGFDFAAWSHALQLFIGDPSRLARLLMINDSIVGPLDRNAYDRVLQRVRDSKADVVGLTYNPKPRPHLQSFFFAFGPRALAMPEWQRMWTAVRSLPSKEMVIDVYETQVTLRMISFGLSVTALFPMPLRLKHSSNVHMRWKQLIAEGFPFIKGHVIREEADDPDLRRLLPENYFSS